MRRLEREDGWPTENAVEIVEPDKKPAVEEKIEEKLAIQAKPHRSKWARQFVIATGVLAILYLAWNYLWPHIRAFATK